MKNYKNCQSCSIPLKKSPNGGGTETDGTLSSKYCAYCYENGRFIHPDWTVEQMQSCVKEKMKAMGFPGFVASIFTWGIPKLERWR
ncbi:MAG: zinc ribbon domain-containing protein [Chlamydiales bacterium]|nr:zinc ribbon domain-containing protein [Chlamydiia bacterium]MCP5507883.1 zinc ribbon domain-containing protein [Chlamydiales bacterium]